MVSLTFTEGTDNVRSIITKEDKKNTDILELTLPDPTVISVGDTVTYRDSTPTTIFSGIVQSLEIGEGEKIAVIFDHGAQLLQRIVNKIYASQSPEAIIQDVLTNFTNLTYVSTITSGVIIDLFVAKDKRAWDVVTEMSEILLANFRVDKDSKFQLELEGTNVSSKNISINNAVLDGSWVEDATQLINSVIVRGDRLIQEKSESFAGPGTQISLAEIPISVNVTVGGSEVTGFIEGSSTGDYTVNRENKNVNFTVSSSTIVAKYTYEIPIKIRRRNASSILTYSEHDKKFEKPYIKSRNEARKYADFILSRFSNPLKSSAWIISNNTDYNDFENYVPNELINVNDTLRTISGNFVIRKVLREFPGKLRISVGELLQDITYWNKEVQVRVKQLEEKEDNSTILTEDEQIDETFAVTLTTDVITFQRRAKNNALYWNTGTNFNDGKIFNGMGTEQGIAPSKFPLRFPFTLA